MFFRKKMANSGINFQRISHQDIQQRINNANNINLPDINQNRIPVSNSYSQLESFNQSNNFSLNTNNNNNNRAYPNQRYSNSNSNSNNTERRGPGGIEIQLSYDNFYDDETWKKNQKNQYGNDLRDQIKEKERLKQLEKLRQQEEDLKEEQRLEKERKELAELAKTELQKREEELKLRKKENQRIISSYSVMSHPKQKRERTVRKYYAPTVTHEKSELEKYLEKRRLEINDYNGEMFNLLKKIQEEQNSQTIWLNDEIKKAKLQKIHMDMYNADIGKEAKALRKAVEGKIYQISFDRDTLYRMYLENKRDKLDLDYIYRINRFKDPPLILSNHIICPGYRINNPWYIDEDLIKKNEELYNEDKYRLQEVMLDSDNKLKKLYRSFS